MQRWQTTLKKGGRSDDALSPIPRDADISNDRADARAADDVLILREQVLAREAQCASEESVGKTRLYQLRESERAVSAYRQAAEERDNLFTTSFVNRSARFWRTARPPRSAYKLFTG